MSERYRTIVADPPWPIGSQGSMPGTAYTERTAVMKPPPYATMSVAAICDLPVAELADDDATLFIWTTSRFLDPAFDVLAAWGFAYSQTLVWRKTGDPSPFAGGSVAPVSHAEFVLVGRRGHPEFAGRFASCVFDAPRARQHSAKPDCFLDDVERVCAGPYVELFARRARFGWDYWGDQSLGTAEVAA